MVSLLCSGQSKPANRKAATWWYQVPEREISPTTPKAVSFPFSILKATQEHPLEGGAVSQANNPGEGREGPPLSPSRQAARIAKGTQPARGLRSGRVASGPSNFKHQEKGDGDSQPSWAGVASVPLCPQSSPPSSLESELAGIMGSSSSNEKSRSELA